MFVTQRSRQGDIVSERLRQETARGSRRLSHALPPDHVRQVLAPDYWPDLPDLTAGYLAANPRH